MPRSNPAPHGGRGPGPARSGRPPVRRPKRPGDHPFRWGPCLTPRGTWQTAGLTVVSPLVTSGPLVLGSGKRLLEAPMAQRPGHAAHKARASGFSPRPAPHRADGTAAR